MAKRSIAYVKGETGSGRARSGRPVQIRTDGFGADVGYLNRLRTAIQMDGRLPHVEKAQILHQLDQLVESLAQVSIARATEEKTA